MEFFEMRIGFSTGSLAMGDFRRGLQLATNERAKAIELSALREEELDPLLNALDSLEDQLRPFEYISFHAPSRLKDLTEADLVDKLQKVAERGWAVIVHPDVIQDFVLWRKLGNAVCIENMDRRKSVGRTAAELQQFFNELPDATFCFDIGHARQVDPTMQEAESFLRCFRDRLVQIHMSYVNSASRHERLNFESRLAFQRVTRWLSDSIPVILETPIGDESIDEEISAAESVFWNPDPAGKAGCHHVNSAGDQCALNTGKGQMAHEQLVKSNQG
jgi:hypothetical protein